MWQRLISSYVIKKRKYNKKAQKFKPAGAFLLCASCVKEAFHLTRRSKCFSIFIHRTKMGVKHYEKRWIDDKTEDKIDDKTKRPGDIGRFGVVGVDWLRVIPGA
jgi:hypothetical protein